MGLEAARLMMAYGEDKGPHTSRVWSTFLSVIVLRYVLEGY